MDLKGVGEGGANEDRLAGCLIGGAIGDAIGLPLEGIKPARAARMYPEFRYRMLFRHGMVSDDTEHACLTALALSQADGDEKQFERNMASGLRRWLCTLPAGAGLATLQSSLKLCARVPPHRSGVPSAGNGPAMRAAIIGAFLANDVSRMRRFVEISSSITHTDSRATDGAYLVALAAAGRPAVREDVATKCWNFDLMQEMLGKGEEPAALAAAMKLDRGVGGFIAHTVPIALYCASWAQGDFRRGITAAAKLGGDTDTVCAIVGGIIGAQVGYRGLPDEWISGLWEWPRSVGWMRRLSVALATGTPPPSTFWPAYALRSPLFIATVLGHGFRRLLPPY